MPKLKKRRKVRPNAGSFKPGPDPRRYRFTPHDCRVGYLVAAVKHPHLREWLKMRVRVHNSKKEKAHGPQEPSRS
jgi:hypothetical protein